jgi:hypothetical protein
MNRSCPCSRTVPVIAIPLAFQRAASRAVEATNGPTVQSSQPSFLAAMTQNWRSVQNLRSSSGIERVDT